MSVGFQCFPITLLLICYKKCSGHNIVRKNIFILGHWLYTLHFILFIHDYITCTTNTLVAGIILIRQIHIYIIVQVTIKHYFDKDHKIYIDFIMYNTNTNFTIYRILHLKYCRIMSVYFLIQLFLI